MKSVLSLPTSRDCSSAQEKERRFWRDTLNGVSRQFYSPTASDIATQ
ncbi:MAG: hypothetical protein J6M35_09755 [Clostridia bacterium]|nr:hypothetical protein [Clostridia bacterium]